jgi:hypothetical protein
MQMPDAIFAYIDLGTGSYVLQVALAGALGASYAVRHFWGRIRRFFGRHSTSADDARG